MNAGYSCYSFQKVRMPYARTLHPEGILGMKIKLHIF
jgi:hypothetical protein